MALPPIPDAHPTPASTAAPGPASPAASAPAAATPAAAAPASPNGPAGVVTVDDKLTLECELACYRSTAVLGRAIAKELRTRVLNRPDTCVVFYTPAAAASLQAYQAFALQSTEIRQALQQSGAKPARARSSPPGTLSLLSLAAVGAAVGAATTTATAVLGLATNFLSLFRTDRDYKGRQVTINERAVFTAVARHLIGDDPPIHVFDPSEIVLTPAVAGLTTGPVLDELRQLHVLRDKAHVALDSGGAAEMDAILQDLGGIQAGQTHQALRDAKALPPDQSDVPAPATEEPPALAQRLKTVAAQVSPEKKHLEHVDQLLDDLVKSLSAIDPKTGASMVALAQQGASLVEHFKKDAYFLEITLLTAGGSYVTERRWFSNKAGYTGGLAVAYTVTNAQGEIVWADMAQHRERGTLES